MVDKAYVIASPDISQDERFAIQHYVNQNSLRSFWPSEYTTLTDAFRAMEISDIVYVYWGDGSSLMSDVDLDMLIRLEKPSAPIFLHE